MRHRRALPHPLPARFFGPPPRRRVGLLGGSFNPAHAGHVHISEQALRRLGLDEIWWLISPQNPLKAARGMASFPARLAEARRATADRRIRVSAAEAAFGTVYTVDTLRALTARFPRTRFVWLMGADNLRQIPHWKEWSSIFHLVPIAVFARSAYDSRALAGKAASRYEKFRRSLRPAGRFASRTPPIWVFFHSRLHPASATSIRQGGGRRDWTISR